MIDQDFDFDLAEIKKSIKKHIRAAWADCRQNDAPFPVFTMLLIKHGIDSMALSSDGEWRQESIDEIEGILTDYYKSAFRDMDQPHEVPRIKKPPKLEIVRCLQES